MNFQNNGFEIDLTGLLLHLRKKTGAIAVVALVCLLMGFLASAVFMEPQYTASTRVYILNRSSDRYSSSDFVIASYMLNDYKVLITGQNVTQEVVNDLKLNMKPAVLAEKIEVTSPEETRVLQIDYTDSDPQQAARIANAVREEAVEQIQSIMEVDAVKLIYAAEAPKQPSSPNVSRYTIVAGLLGGMLMAAIYTVTYILNDSIRTEEDVERYLGLSTLGVIPVAKDLSVNRKKDRRFCVRTGFGRRN